MAAKSKAAAKKPAAAKKKAARKRPAAQKKKTAAKSAGGRGKSNAGYNNKSQWDTKPHSAAKRGLLNSR